MTAPPLWAVEDARAIQALALYAQNGGDPPSQGDVNRALDWIIHTACGTYDEPFRPGRQDSVNYMLGRRSVGLAIIKLMKLKVGKFTT